jgi:hypothetical protein
MNFMGNYGLKKTTKFQHHHHHLGE